MKTKLYQKEKSPQKKKKQKVIVKIIQCVIRTIFLFHKNCVKPKIMNCDFLFSIQWLLKVACNLHR
jgi:hypothetical protein